MKAIHFYALVMLCVSAAPLCKTAKKTAHKQKPAHVKPKEDSIEEQAWGKDDSASAYTGITTKLPTVQIKGAPYLEAGYGKGFGRGLVEGDHIVFKGFIFNSSSKPLKNVQLWLHEKGFYCAPIPPYGPDVPLAPYRARRRLFYAASKEVKVTVLSLDPHENRAVEFTIPCTNGGIINVPKGWEPEKDPSDIQLYIR